MSVHDDEELEPQSKPGKPQLPRVVCMHCGNVFQMKHTNHYVCDDCVRKAMSKHGFTTD